MTTETQESKVVQLDTSKQQFQFTNRMLLDIHNEFEAYRRTSPGLCILLRTKFNEFYNEHRVRINSIYDKLYALQKEYFEFVDEKKTQIKTDVVKEEGKPDMPVPVMLTGKDKNEFDEKCNVILNAPVSNLFIN